MNERLRKTVVKYLIILGIAVVYLVFVLCTGWGIPCPIFSLTGLECPACGVSRMLVSIVKLDFAAAFAYNPFLMIAGPVIIAYLVFSEIKYIKTGSPSMGKWEILLWILSGAAIVYGIIRNII